MLIIQIIFSNFNVLDLNLTYSLSSVLKYDFGITDTVSFIVNPST